MVRDRNVSLLTSRMVPAEACTLIWYIENQLRVASVESDDSLPIIGKPAVILHSIGESRPIVVNKED